MSDPSWSSHSHAKEELAPPTGTQKKPLRALLVRLIRVDVAGARGELVVPQTFVRQQLAEPFLGRQRRDVPVESFES